VEKSLDPDVFGAQDTPSKAGTQRMQDDLTRIDVGKATDNLGEIPFFCLVNRTYQIH
jgi:hypothetical protein